MAAALSQTEEISHAIGSEQHAFERSMNMLNAYGELGQSSTNE